MKRSPMEVVPGRLVGVTIEAESTRLQRIAQEYQEAWFKYPDSVEAKRAYGYALRQWAACTGNKTALQHAEYLLEVTQC